MARILAFEWDGRQLCAVAGTRRGTVVSIDEVITEELSHSEPEAVAEAFKRICDRGAARGATVLVALGRGVAEIRRLHLPPMPEEELPDAVRFQAVRQFASAGERAIIDFVPIRSDSSGTELMVAAVGPEVLKAAEKVVAASELELSGLFLRPLGASSLLRVGGNGGGGEETLMIDLFEDEADFVIVRNEKPIFVRSIRLPSEDAAREKQLAGEVRRSLTACQQADGSATATRRIILWGSAAVHASEAAAIRENLGLEVECIDPFDLVTVDAKLKSNLPEHRGRFAPLLGLLAAGGTATPDLIDFKNPRRRPEVQSKKGKLGILAAAVTAALVLIALMGYRQLSAIDRDIARLAKENAGLTRFVDAATDSQGDLNALNAFRNSDVFWLEELRQISEQLPPGDVVVLNSVTLQASPTEGGGTISLTGLITDQLQLAQLEQNLRDEYRVVQGDGATYSPGNPPYNYSFTERIVVSGQAVQQNRQRASVEAAGAAPQDGEAAGETTEAAVRAKDAPAEDAPAEDAPTEVAPTEDGPTEKPSTEEDPAEEADAVLEARDPSLPDGGPTDSSDPVEEVVGERDAASEKDGENA